MIGNTFDLNYKSDMVSPLQLNVKYQDLFSDSISMVLLTYRSDELIWINVIVLTTPV